MRLTSRHQVFSVCCSLIFPGAFAASAQTPKPDYSKEGMVVEKLTTEVTFAKDGTSLREQTFNIRVQSESALRDLGVLVYPYNSENEKLDFVYIRVRKPDGTVVATSNTGIQDIAAEVTRSAPTFSDLRGKQVPVKALGVGDVLEYQIRATTFKADVANQFWYTYDFFTAGISLEETLSIVVPAGQYVKVKSPALNPNVKEESGVKTYFWKTSNLKASRPDDEPRKPVDKDEPAHSVQLTTFHNWQEVGRWYGQLADSQTRVTPQVQAKAAELTKGLDTDALKEHALYNFVSAKFRYISLSFGTGRYQPHSADEVLANQYGDCKDKHTLLATMLKAVGIEAWPALIGAGLKFDSDMPSPAQFNHVITVIGQGPNPLWLDTTAEVAPFGMLTGSIRDKQALVVPVSGDPVIMTTPAESPFPSSQLMESKSELNGEGTLKGHFDMTFRGDIELLLRAAFHETPPAKWQEMAQQIARGMGFAGKVSNVEVENLDDSEKPFHYSYDYVRENYSDWPNRRITAPLVPFALPGTENDKPPMEPINLGERGEIIYRATLRLPSGYSAELPSRARAEAQFGTFTSNYSVAGSVLTAERHVVLNTAKIQVAMWPEYRKFRKTMEDDANTFIVLDGGNSNSRGSGVGNNPRAEQLIQRAEVSRDPNEARASLAEAEHLVRASLADDPDNLLLQQQLTEALLRGGKKDEGVDAARKLGASDDPVLLNDVAFLLADNGAGLPLAREYAERAVAKVESSSKEITLASLTDQDMRQMNALANDWSTLGFAWFKLGDFARAEKYLDAAWKLGQAGDAAVYLAQVYEKQGRRDDAIRTLRLALAANNGLIEARDRLRALGASADTPRGSVSPSEQLGKMRTTAIPSLTAQQGSAEFFILFSKDKVEDTQFISGSPGLKDAGDSLARARFGSAFPDDAPERIVRRGILSCSKYTTPSCQMILLLPSNANR